jgi:3',5'-cyclic AMP phosphodiesterase CpdA
MIIAQVTDTHILPKTKYLFNDPRIDTASRLRSTVDYINHLKPLPNLVIFSGDLTDQGEIEAYEHFKEIISTIKAPYHLIPGNHDNRENLINVFPEYTKLLNSQFIQYLVTSVNLGIILLDTLEVGKVSGYLCDKRLAFLKNSLEKYQNLPIIIFSHHPLHKIGQDALDSIICKSQEDLGEIIKYYPNILGLCSGHFHKFFFTRFANTNCFICPSTATSFYYEAFIDMRPQYIELLDPGFNLYRIKNNNITVDTKYVVDQESRILMEYKKL